MSIRAAVLSALVLACLAAPPALSAPVATDDGSYQVLGRVFPDPQGACNQGPCSPNAQGNLPATTFIGYEDLVKGLTYMNKRKEWLRYMEVWTLDGDLDGNSKADGTDDATPGTKEADNFPGNNLGEWEFTPSGRAHSAGLPQPDVGRLRSDVFVVRVTDETVPDAGKQRMALSLSIHGIERAGLEGGTRAMEDLVTAATTGKLDKPILGTKGLDVSIPTFKQVLQKTIIYFTFPNPDGWRRGDVGDTTKGPGVFFQRYNGNGVDLNRDFPDIGFSFRPYSSLSEPESRGWAGAFQQIKTHGAFSAGDDLHGMLGADSFSYTLLPHGSHDYAKNERLRRAAQSINLVQQTALAWSPLIQPNDQPRGSCNNKPVVGADCYPMYGQSWGSVYDTINYTTTGALGDYMNSSIGLNADGIDNEMAYSHLDKDIVFEPVIEQMHVDGNKGLIYAHLSEILNPRKFVFPARGRHGYVPITRVKRAESTGGSAIPAGTKAQEDYDKVEQTPGDQIFPFTVKQGDGIYNGGMRVDITSQNLQGIDPTAQNGKTLSVECRNCDQHRGVADKDDKDWVVVATDYNQSGLYLQAGLTVAVNKPQAVGANGKPVEWRAKVSNGPPGQMRIHVSFTQGPATTDGTTGGDAPPRTAAYDVASTDFWKKLDPFTAAGAGFEAVDPADLAKKDDAKVPDALDTLVLTDEPLPGYAFPALPAVKLPADIGPDKFHDTHPTAPCGYTDGLPHSPTCGESFDFSFTEKGLGRVVVTMTPTAGDLTLTVVKVNDDGSETQIGSTSDQGGDKGTESIALAYPDPGKYRAYVDNFAAPTDSSWKGTIHFEGPSIGKVGSKSTYTDAEWQRYAGKLKAFVEGGGNLVLTDGAMQTLPFLFPKIARTDVTRNISYVGQVAFTTKATDSQDAPTEGNTLKDPLAKGVALPGARFNSGLRRQTYEPTPIGYSIQDESGGNASTSPQWVVTREAFEAAGGRVAATATSGDADMVKEVTVGELKLGKGVVRVVGALLPQPSEDFDHQEGLEPFSVTYTGYKLAENVTDWCSPAHCSKPLPATPAPATPATPSACDATRAFSAASAKARGRGLRFAFTREGTAPVRIDLFQISRGRRVLHEHLVARFTSREALTWDGSKRGHFTPTDGYYFVRMRVVVPSGQTVYRRIALRRSHGRWSRQPQFFGTARCTLLRQFKLTRAVFGGSNHQLLGASYVVQRSAPVTITVSRGKKVVARFRAAQPPAKKVVHVTLRKRGLPRGLYRVRIVAGTERATLWSRKL